MSKRGAADAANPRKRQKIVHEAPTSEDIHTSRQLSQLLMFEQDLQKARHGLQSFKVFLDGLLTEDGAKDDQVQILTEYLEHSKRHESGESDGSYLPDIMETWSFASQANNDNIMSAVPVALALLMRFISQRLELTAHGLGIGRTILQKRQELVARNLSVDKGKEFIISPTLRLLKETMCLDGGTMAKPIFRARSFTFKALARNMGIKYLGEGVEELKRPSTRTNAIRFFLSALKFLHVEAKIELLSQKEIAPALTRSLKDDPRYLIVEILDTLRNHVLKDEKLPGNIKGKLLNSMALSRIAFLYNYEHEVAQEGAKVSVEDAVHSFLMAACTSPTVGILRPQSGFYPRSVDPDAPSLLAIDDEVEPGLESITWMNKFRNDVPVRNVILADFIQTLRPYSSTKQSELILAIFEAAPELVAHYFINKRSFTFEPKLSATWVGFSAFLFKTIQLPIPETFGHKSGYAHAPPPTSILIDNIIPLPLNQKVLGKCLAQKSDLIPFVAIRLLVMAMQKLQVALKLHDDAAKGSSKSLWKDSARKLVDEFCQRTPGIKDIITTYRGIGDSDLLQREAVSKLLRLYYEVIPQVALMAKFDVSSSLITAIQRLDKAEESPGDRTLRLIELENLLAIAGYSPGMRWFSKAQSLSVSPFVALLKVLVAAPEGVSVDALRDALRAVAEEQQLIPVGRVRTLPLLSALQSMRGSSDVASQDGLWAYLDSSVSRCATTPIKYLEMILDLADGNGAVNTTSVSPLTMAMLEQLPFAIKSAGDAELPILARLLAIYINYSRGQEDEAQLKEVLEKMKSSFPEKAPVKDVFKRYSNSTLTKELQSWGADFSPRTGSPKEVEEKTEERMSEAALEDFLLVPSPFDSDNSALSKWPSKEPDELVEEGYAASVISLLASEHTSIRKESLIGISKMAAKIKDSSYEEKEQVWLLLSELVESCRSQVDDGPVPNTIVAFGRHALEVLKDPLHCLYGKINTFLTRGPAWKLDKLPLVHDILHEGPELDDTFYSELSWLFAYLLDCLQSSADMSLFHNTRLFERLLSLTSNPYMRQNLRNQVLKMIYRATCIEGGSTTLITRFGIVAWLETESTGSSSAKDTRVYTALSRRVWQTSDQEKVSKWSLQGVETVVA